MLLEGYKLRLGLSSLPADTGRIDRWVLQWDLHLKGTGYDLTLVITGLHDEPVQIPIDAPGLRRSLPYST